MRCKSTLFLGRDQANHSGNTVRSAEGQQLFDKRYSKYPPYKTSYLPALEFWYCMRIA